MLELRLARPEDCATVAALEQACFSRPQSEASFAAQVDVPNALLLTAWLDGCFCGYLSVYYVWDRAQILTVAVCPEHRRKGVARALLAWLFSDARSRGCVAVELEVRSNNASARSLYEALGFVTVGQRKNYYRDPVDDALLMDKSL